MKVREYLNQGRELLSRAQLECSDPNLHMQQILAAGLGWNTAQLYVRWEEDLSEEQRMRLDALMKRRLTGEPYQYVVGEEWFWKSRFAVGSGVLIPRRETELLVETALQRCGRELKVAELGPGSGNIGMACLLERPQWEWHGFERNPETWPYLEKNRRDLLPPEAAYFIHRGDFFELASQHGPYDAILANPPYVKQGDFPTLSKEVRSEPPMALDGGVSGLEVVSRLVREAVSLLKPDGILALEIGSDQEAAALFLARRNSFADAEVIRDYAGLPRLLWGKRRN